VSRPLLGYPGLPTEPLFCSQRTAHGALILSIPKTSAELSNLQNFAPTYIAVLEPSF
jgi:hypothetical protein